MIELKCELFRLCCKKNKNNVKAFFKKEKESRKSFLVGFAIFVCDNNALFCFFPRTSLLTCMTWQIPPTKMYVPKEPVFCALSNIKWCHLQRECSYIFNRIWADVPSLVPTCFTHVAGEWGSRSGEKKNNAHALLPS